MDGGVRDVDYFSRRARAHLQGVPVPVAEASVCSEAPNDWLILHVHVGGFDGGYRWWVWGLAPTVDYGCVGFREP